MEEKISETFGMQGVINLNRKVWSEETFSDKYAKIKV
jgi:hypothetical protein